MVVVYLMAEDVLIYSQGDQVLLRTTRNVSYISHPPAETPSPRGIWLVAAGVDGDLLLTKQSTTIRIPAADVQMYMRRDTIDQQLRRVLDGTSQADQGRPRKG